MSTTLMGFCTDRWASNGQVYWPIDWPPERTGEHYLDHQEEREARLARRRHLESVNGGIHSVVMPTVAVATGATKFVRAFQLIRRQFVGQAAKAERIGPNSVGSRADLHIQLRDRGFTYHATTKGGYVRYTHSNGSNVYIRPNGQVLRTGPPRTPAGGGKAYNPRVDAFGNRIQSHNPAEFVTPLQGG